MGNSSSESSSTGPPRIPARFGRPSRTVAHARVVKPGGRATGVEVAAGDPPGEVDAVGEGEAVETGMLGSEGAGVICRPTSGTGPRRLEAARNSSTRTVSTIRPTGMRDRRPGVPRPSSGPGVRGRRAGRMPARRPRVRTYLVTPGAPLPGPTLRVPGVGPPEPWPRASRALMRRSDGNGTPSVTGLRTGTPRPGRSTRDGPPGGHVSCFAFDSQRGRYPPPRPRRRSLARRSSRLGTRSRRVRASPCRALPASPSGRCPTTAMSPSGRGTQRGRFDRW